MRKKGVYGVILSTTAVVAAISLWCLRKKLIEKQRKKKEQTQHSRTQRTNKQVRKGNHGYESAEENEEKKRSLDPETAEWVPPIQPVPSRLSASAKEFIPAPSTDSPSGGARLSASASPFIPLQLETIAGVDGGKKSRFEDQIMYIMRGLPGSGKSTLAKILLRDPAAAKAHLSTTSKKSSWEAGTEASMMEAEWSCSYCGFSNNNSVECGACGDPRPSREHVVTIMPEADVSSSLGVIFSTDDFFIRADGTYNFDAKLLHEAHQWNQQRTYEALVKGITPIIIDNTMTRKREAKWYVQMGIKYGYKIYFVEPNTPWARNPRQLAKKNSHGVPREKIKEMLSRWEDDFSIAAIINCKNEYRNLSRKKKRHRRKRR